MSSILSSLVFGAIGLWALKQGKKNADIRVILIGAVLLAYTYFTHSPWADWGIGLALCGLLYRIG